MKWFDLSSHNGKLERSQEESGAFYLKLTLKQPVDTTIISLATGEGWVGSTEKPGVEFRNYRPFNRTSSIVNALEPFFDREEIVRAKVDRHKLTQNEELKGFSEPLIIVDDQGLYPPSASVEADLKLILAPEKRKRILDRIEAAQKIMGVSSAPTLFNGQAIQIWHDLAKSVGYFDATASMISAIERTKSAGETAAKYHDQLVTAAETGSQLPVLNEDVPSDRYGLTVAKKLQANFKSFSSLSQDWDEPYFYRAFTRAVEANFAIWDSKSFGAPASDVESYGTKFISDPAMPRSWKESLFERVSQAIAQSARMIGVPARDLFGNSITFHLGKRIGLADALGYMSTRQLVVDGSKMTFRTVKFSPHAVGVVAHEMGHAIDYSHREYVEADEIENLLLDQTEIRSFIQDVTARAGLRPERLDYLNSPSEMIARTFEAALADYMRGQGDSEYRSAGGATMMNGGFDYAPPKELTEKFVLKLGELISLSKDNRLDEEEELRSSTEIAV